MIAFDHSYDTINKINEITTNKITQTKFILPLQQNTFSFFPAITKNICATLPIAKETKCGYGNIHRIDTKDHKQPSNIEINPNTIIFNNKNTFFMLTTPLSLA